MDVLLNNYTSGIFKVQKWSKLQIQLPQIGNLKLEQF